MSLALTTADPNRTFEPLGVFITREAPLGRNDILPLLLVDSDSVLYNLWLGVRDRHKENLDATETRFSFLDGRKPNNRPSPHRRSGPR